MELIQHIVNIFVYDFAYRDASILILEDPVKLWTHHIFLQELPVVRLDPFLEQRRCLLVEALRNLVLADLFAFDVDITLSRLCTHDE